MDLRPFAVFYFAAFLLGKALEPALESLSSFSFPLGLWYFKDPR